MEAQSHLNQGMVLRASDLVASINFLEDPFCCYELQRLWLSGLGI